MSNTTRDALARSSRLEDLAYRIDLLANEAAAAGMVLAAGQLLSAADNISSEAAWIWDTRNAPETVRIQGGNPWKSPQSSGKAH
jgi:hypothetical protein